MYIHVYMCFHICRERERAHGVGWQGGMRRNATAANDWFAAAAAKAHPYTLNPEPRTLNPQPYTLNPQPPTVNPQPSTLHPTPYTLHPEP